MKKTLGLALVGGLMALGIGQSQAQTSSTFVLQNLNFALTGFAGGATGGTNTAAVATPVGNKQIINSLINTLGLSGSNLGKAKLQLGTATDGTTSFLLTSGTGKNMAAVDVSPFFSINTVVGPLFRNKQAFSIDTFDFNGSGSSGTNTNSVVSGLTFALQGFTTRNSNGAFNSSVNGSGTDQNGNTAVLKGTVSATAPTKAVTIVVTGGGGTISTNSP